jgi:hypothetical protein
MSLICIGRGHKKGTAKAKTHTTAFASGSSRNLESSFGNDEGLAHLYKAPVDIIAIGDLDVVNTFCATAIKLSNCVCEEIMPLLSIG